MFFSHPHDESNENINFDDKYSKYCFIELSRELMSECVSQYDWINQCAIQLEY